jgi:lauroyl/myristoyl acyltransferase
MTEGAGVKSRRLSAGNRPYFTRDDASFLLEFPVLFLTAALIPEEHWHRVTLRLERIKSALRRFSPDKIKRGLRLLPGAPQDADAALKIAATRSEHHLQIIRDYFFGWSAPVDLVGREHVDAALAAGRGAVLWVAHFSFNALAAKKAFHEAGFAVSHLSRPEHGFSKSRFGIAFLNPLRVNAELRYLKGRIIIDRAKPAAAVTRGQKELKANGIISITAGAWEGAKIATVDVHGAALDLSTGAPGLAVMTGAALLPVFTVRSPGTTRIAVVVGEPIPVDRGTDRDEKMLNATQIFADRLAPYIDSHPIQWRDWEKIRERKPSLPDTTSP